MQSARKMEIVVMNRVIQKYLNDFHALPRLVDFRTRSLGRPFNLVPQILDVF
jgi:hypothetical protein